MDMLHATQVIHPKTMVPAIASSIPVFIRNTFNHRGKGTRIYRTSARTLHRKVWERLIAGDKRL